MKKLFIIGILIAASITTQAEFVFWAGEGNLEGSDNYANAKSWKTIDGDPGLPTSSNTYGIIASYGDSSTSNSMPIISSLIGSAPQILRIASTGWEGMLTIQAGGSIILNALEIGTDNIGTGTLKVSGGSLTVTNGLNMGTEGTAIIDHTGGTIHLDTLSIGEEGTVNLSPGAMFIVDGDQTSASWLTSFKSTVGATIDRDFDGTQTSITTIPEPATIGLVATFGGALLFIRRKYKR